MDKKISSISELKHWIRIQLALNDITQKEIAEKWGIAYPRISEAVNGKNKKCLKRLILEFGGNLEDFEDIIKIRKK